MIKIVSANFITSSPSIKEAPVFNSSEIVFLGRSNVGKSSLINSLTKHNSLAKSSSTPGKTQLINFFEICLLDDEKGEKFNVIFVDLPGFGYARVAKSTHNEWKKNLDEFLKSRETIRLFVHLIDSRHFDLEIDKNVNEYITSFLRPDQKLLNLYTKSDKLNQSLKSAVLKNDPDGILVSTLNKNGIEKALNTIIKKTLGSE
ncbi:ribosome biogenesis GTP-binding protein YihA/YsxC [Campylobacter pinnipediorum]|uniref:Probable GTP-binding protein EngB n=1 Tax=Campylobacter pinnipediorum subsp. pinnipediorum TaxID=1660067 RepID=A0AAX0LCW5_9BACT|nr:ribosome biogenesis GTP-binding protein YihA/YsxC [Campylobacter pinnipediorum]AQW83293.1 ribosome biogenesis GTP-binding protein YsxC/EngB [Campylobacter pinnipediorum subsp. pinnipediorum]OPA79719.1 YihA family ribosome biogenesis GTP-binding protein [Campylobacter pinnipediorum subsp. pinnipediorum]OPA81677.1 YihA family ribosome biogenesis GTP-binding protein [Campylobacter pinnipediorum subsp. pinnipediorum]